MLLWDIKHCWLLIIIMGQSMSLLGQIKASRDKIVKLIHLLEGCTIFTMSLLLRTNRAAELYCRLNAMKQKWLLSIRDKKTQIFVQTTSRVSNLDCSGLCLAKVIPSRSSQRRQSPGVHLIKLLFVVYSWFLSRLWLFNPNVAAQLRLFLTTNFGLEISQKRFVAAWSTRSFSHG